MKKIFALIMFFAALNASSAVWTDLGLTFGSNEFSRNEATFAANLSTRIVAGLSLSAYKLEKQNYVSALRMPINIFIGKSFMLTAKPYLYPKNSDGSAAAGGKLSASLVKDNPEEETSVTYTISAAHQKQNLGIFPEKKITSDSAEIQAEKNFYDQFFLLAAAAFNRTSAFSSSKLKNYCEISDLFSVNTHAFLNDDVHSRAGFQFARSFMPDFNSYFYAGYDRLNARISDYNSWLIGLRVNFSDKNFANFSYNYLDAKRGDNKVYYKFGIGIFFE